MTGFIEINLKDFARTRQIYGLELIPQYNVTLAFRPTVVDGQNKLNLLDQKQH